MRKSAKFTSVLLIFVMALSVFFSACGGGGTAAPSDASYLTDFGYYPLQGDPATAPEASITDGGDVTWSAWMTPMWEITDESISQGELYTLEEYLLETMHRFAASYEGANIKEIIVDNFPSADRDEKLSVAMNTNTLPDFIFESFFSIGSRAHEGLFLDLSSIVTDQARKDIPQGVWDSVTVVDGIYSYPFAQGQGFLSYNADLFRAAGLDKYIAGENDLAVWSDTEYMEILEALNKTLPDTVDPMLYFCVSNQGDTWNLAWMRMFGGEWFDEEGYVIANNPDTVKGLEYMVNIKNQGLCNENPEGLASGDAFELFYAQQTAIGILQAGTLAQLRRNMELSEVEEFDVRIAAIPGTSPRVFSYVYGFEAFNTGNDVNMAITLDYLKWLNNDLNLIAESRWMGAVNSTVSEAYADFDPMMAAYAKGSEYLFNFSNNSVGYSELRNILYPELQAAFSGSKTPQQALDDYTAAANKIIEEGMKNSVLYS